MGQEYNTLLQGAELSAPARMSDPSIKLPENDMGKEGIPSDSISSVSGVDGAVGQPLEVYYPPTSCYDYRYPGYNGTFPQSDDKGYINTVGGSYTGIQPDSASLLYYLPGPGYGPYTSSEYLQQPCSYGSEAFPCYTYDLAYARNGLTSPASRSGLVRSVVGPSDSGKSNGFNTAKTNNNLSSKISSQQPASHLSRSIYQNPSLNSTNKQLGSGFQSSSLIRGYPHAAKFSSFPNQSTRVSTYNNPVNYQSNNRVWNSNYRYRSRENFGRSGETKAVTELTRGPRADNKNKNPSKLPSEVEQLAIDRNKYNLQEFQTEYDSAKFYVIKSNGEYDVHKSIKYDVWSSTPNGNKKLDVAFCEAEAKTKETGVKCPVFLFFSVNGSGQFVGVAEMIGPVDFGKNMEFWQLDKWNGFFPVKWHIVKDVPNTQLRHIILENNDNRPVTYSRDTQEIGLKQGLEMLSIFKSYSEKASLLDDFNFYESREKPKRNARPVSQTNGLKNGDHEKHFEAGEEIVGEQSAKDSESDPSSLVSLTKNLSLDS
ncbi:hypothetical protein DH2020_024118 [Rehmannia glutinosa]|uniref:YTH domain-containing family protein n=1 Tax=Rehmannia glutinosa TaxID=99300 RepID=A0ABR0WC61_REHGL